MVEQRLAEERKRIIAALESGHPTERDIFKARVLGIPLLLIDGRVAFQEGTEKKETVGNG